MKKSQKNPVMTRFWLRKSPAKIEPKIPGDSNRVFSKNPVKFVGKNRKSGCVESVWPS